MSDNRYKDVVFALSLYGMMRRYDEVLEFLEKTIDENKDLPRYVCQNVCFQCLVRFSEMENEEIKKHSSHTTFHYCHEGGDLYDLLNVLKFMKPKF